MKELVDAKLDEYEDYLPVQYGESFNLRTFLTVFTKQIQVLDQELLKLDAGSTNIDVAVGYQLDIIGKLVGAERAGRSDIDFRGYIKFKIVVNSGSGTAEDVIFYLDYILGETDNIRIFEHPPASIYVHVTGNIDPLSTVTSELGNILGAGIEVGYISYAATERVLTPYSSTVVEEPLLDSSGNQITDNLGNPLSVLNATEDPAKMTLGVLEELYVDVKYDIVTDSDDSIVTSTGDNLQVFSYKNATGSGAPLQLPEVLPKT